MEGFSNKNFILFYDYFMYKSTDQKIILGIPIKTKKKNYFRYIKVIRHFYLFIFIGNKKNVIKEKERRRKKETPQVHRMCTNEKGD